MSAIAERALAFYLTHSDVVDGVEASQGQVHRVYSCPECTGSVVLRDGEMIAVQGQVGVLNGSAAMTRERRCTVLDQQGEEELVPC